MKKLLAILLLAYAIPAQSQQLKEWGEKQLKFATFYTAVTGNNSLAGLVKVNPHCWAEAIDCGVTKK